MKMRDESSEKGTEAAGVGGAHMSIILTSSHESGAPPPTTYDIDERNAPPVFGSLWREFVSVLTLAIAPGLNVCRYRGSSDGRL